MTITEELLECIDCAWVGLEEEAVENGNAEDAGYLCPACNEQCAHFPLDEIGNELETVISHGWTKKSDPRGSSR